MWNTAGRHAQIGHRPQQVGGAQQEEPVDGKVSFKTSMRETTVRKTPQGADAGISEYLPAFHLDTPGSPCKPLTPARPTHAPRRWSEFDALPWVGPRAGAIIHFAVCIMFILV
eukprot:4525725-Prymnesium_polylepis.1